MAGQHSAKSFRTAFRLAERDVLLWFPGHMDKGLRKMQQTLKNVDCIIEVHDARIPFSGRNPAFKRSVLGIKPHLLVMNKVDLIPAQTIPSIEAELRKEVARVVFTNCKDDTSPGLRKVFPAAQELISASDRFNRSNSDDFNIMIIGVPNVGKSSLINVMRNKHLKKQKASRVGGVPGITRSVLNKIKVSEKPEVYMLDTPGILTPSIPDTTTGLKLSLCNVLQDHLVGEETICDFLLFWLNKEGHFSYVDKFGLEEPCDAISVVLQRIAVSLGRHLNLKQPDNTIKTLPDLTYAAKHMLKVFRSGELGKIMLDQDVLRDRQEKIAK